MSDFGDRLKQAREDKGVSLRDIAAATKISMTALEALERGDFSRLPGGIFSRAFVRAYAIEVGLDPEAAVRSFLVEFERGESRAAEVAPPEVTDDDREFLERQRQARRVLRAVVVGLVLVLVLGLAYWQLRGRSTPPANSRTETRSRAVDAAEPAPPPASTGAPVPTEVAALTVAVEVTAACWVQVNADGATSPILQRILNTGERQEFQADRELVLQVGNAGAVRWFINGQPAKPMGKAGDRSRRLVTRANYRDYLQ